MGVTTRQVLKLNTLGGFTLENADGGAITLRNRKACALLAYLSLCGQSRVNRGRLTGLLWSESDESSARASLRQCLRRMKIALGAEFRNILLVDNQEVGLLPDAIEVDVVAVERSLTDQEKSTAIRPDHLSPEQILYGFDDVDSSFTSWLRVARQTWHHRLTTAAVAVLNSADHDAAQKMECAAALFSSDATHEPAARCLIETRLAQGNLAGALSVYDQIWNALDAEWGEEPSSDLQSLIVQARTVEPHPSVEVSAIVQDGPPRIALGEFRQAGPWLQADYYITGFHLELLGSLTRFREWAIVDPKGEAADFLIEGGYYEASDGLQLTVTLKDASASRYITSEILSIDFADWKESVRRIVRRVAVSLNIHINNSRLSNDAMRPAFGQDAFDIWLKANNLMSQYRPDTFDRAEELLQQVVQSAPDYAPAYSSLASINNVRHLIAPGRERRSEWTEAALKYANKAIDLDPLDPRCQIAMAWSNIMAGSFGQGELHFGLSHELNPISPQTLVPCAHGLSFCGKHETANRLVDEAQEIQPSLLRKHWGYAMCIRFFARRFAESAEAGERAGDAIIDLLGWRAAAQAMGGDAKEAARTMDQFVETARAHWLGPTPPEPDTIGSWFMSSFPIRSRKDRQMLWEGLNRAGLPAQ